MTSTATTPPPPPTPLSPHPPPTPSSTQLEKELQHHEPQEIVIQIERSLLRIFSFFLLINGLIALYNELVELFYIYPHIPAVFNASNFSESIYQAVFRRSIILIATASLETIYGLILIKRHHSLAHRIHLISSLGLVIISFVIRSTVGTHDHLIYDRLPQAPTFNALIHQKDFPTALQLFRPQL